MNVTKRFAFVVLLILLVGGYIFPWKQFGISMQNDFINKPYVLGLDLQGGVELDYQVDFSALETQSGAEVIGANGQSFADSNKQIVVEGLKKIIDNRVSSLGLTEPTIQSLRYGDDTHLIVQIPTESYAELSDAERVKRQKQDIENAKEVIGKVVQLEFKELREGKPTNEEYENRRAIVARAKEDIATMDIRAFSHKYQSNYEGVQVKSGTGTLPQEIISENFDPKKIETFPYVGEIENTAIPIGTTNS